jgi:hypothetical protein
VIPARNNGISDQEEGEMKRSINFASIFRRKDDRQPTHSSEQADQGLLAQRLVERKITLKEGDLKPLTEESPPLDWATVNGQLTLPAAIIDGLLEGRARIRARHLKSLTSLPIGSEVPDATEYAVSLAAVVPQIEDLLQSGEAETSGQPEFETPFSALAKEDSARFASANQKKHKPKSHGQTASDEPVSFNGIQSPQTVSTEKEDDEGSPKEQTSLTEPRADSRVSVHSPEARAEALDVEDNARQHVAPEQGDCLPLNERSGLEPEKAAPQLVSGPIKQFRFEAAPEEDPDIAYADVPRCERDEDPARRGVEQLQEIFMVSEPLNGRRVALLLQQFPGVTGALILLEGGPVLGGKLPDSLSLEAALQAPEVLATFIRFIVQLEAGRKAQSRFVSVTSATNISLVRSGQIVLLVSHQNRKLPPGLAQRLTETAEALNLIYGNACS